MLDGPILHRRFANKESNAMLSKMRSKSIFALLLVSSTPVWLGTTCPGGEIIVAPTTLVNETQSSPYVVTFTPVVGQVVTVSVTGSLTASRPEFVITPFGAPSVLTRTVANGTVNSNSTTGTFTPTAATLHVLTGADAVAAGGDFSINVVQAAP